VINLAYEPETGFCPGWHTALMNSVLRSLRGGLARHLPPCVLVPVGSQAHGLHSLGADLDLALCTPSSTGRPEPDPSKAIGHLQELLGVPSWSGRGKQHRAPAGSPEEPRLKSNKRATRGRYCNSLAPLARILSATARGTSWEVIPAARAPLIRLRMDVDPPQPERTRGSLPSVKLQVDISFSIDSVYKAAWVRAWLASSPPLLLGMRFVIAALKAAKVIAPTAHGLSTFAVVNTVLHFYAWHWAPRGCLSLAPALDTRTPEDLRPGSFTSGSLPPQGDLPRVDLGMGFVGQGASPSLLEHPEPSIVAEAHRLTLAFFVWLGWLFQPSRELISAGATCTEDLVRGDMIRPYAWDALVILDPFVDRNMADNLVSARGPGPEPMRWAARACALRLLGGQCARLVEPRTDVPAGTQEEAVQELDGVIAGLGEVARVTTDRRTQRLTLTLGAGAVEGPPPAGQP